MHKYFHNFSSSVYLNIIYICKPTFTNESENLLLVKLYYYTFFYKSKRFRTCQEQLQGFVKLTNLFFSKENQIKRQKTEEYLQQMQSKAIALRTSQEHL